MERPTDLKRVLAEEIRAAIAETAPAPGEPRDGEGTATAPARASMRRAAEALTPSVPAGAPLEPVKRLAIRALRFLLAQPVDVQFALARRLGPGGRRSRSPARGKRAPLGRARPPRGRPGGAPDAGRIGRRRGEPARGGHGPGRSRRGVPVRGLRVVRGAIPRQPRTDRKRPALVPGSSPGRGGARAGRRLRTGRVPAPLEGRGRRRLRHRVEPNLGGELSSRRPGRRGGGRARVAGGPARGAARRDRGVPGGRALAARRPPAVPPAGAAGARAGRASRRRDDQRGLDLGPQGVLPRSDRTCGPCLPRRCGFSPRPPASRTSGSSTARHCRPPSDSRRAPRTSAS